jgi:N4-gp56 family major capsid protein
MGNTNTTTYGDISPRTAGAAKARLLERGQHLMVVERFGQVDPQQKNKTKSCKWRRYNSFPRALQPLSEGVPPAGTKLTYVDITATLEQYGDAYPITDVIVDTHEDKVLQEMIDLSGEAAAETIETIRINILKAGTNVFYANGATSRDTVSSPPTRGDFRLIYRYFKNNKAREISQVIAASAKISTEPVDAAYFVMGSTDLDADIRAIPGFVPAINYADSTKTLPGEIGKIDQFRIILTAMFEPWSGAATSATGTTYLSGGVEPASALAPDVYPLLFVARDSYGIVPLQGYNAVTPMVVNPKPSASQPLGQKGWVSWKTYQTAAILNQSWLARLECAATARPTD